MTLVGVGLGVSASIIHSSAGRISGNSYVLNGGVTSDSMEWPEADVVGGVIEFLRFFRMERTCVGVFSVGEALDAN